jgi:hypothetical protein
MFEMIRGTSKGTKLANTISESTMETVNWLIKENNGLGTHDTLFINSYYYCYALLIVTPTNLQRDKSELYMGAIIEQSKSVIFEWLEKLTGNYMIDEHIYSLDSIFGNFCIELKDETNSSDIEPLQVLDVLKTQAMEKLIKDMANKYPENGVIFNILIGNQCSHIRNSLT